MFEAKTEDVFKEQWKQLRKHAKTHWMALSEEDIKRVDGNVDTLAELLRERYGYSQEKAMSEIQQFADLYVSKDKP